MANLLSRAVVTPEDLRRLGSLGAFDWAVTKLRDAITHLGPSSGGFTVEIHRVQARAEIDAGDAAELD